MLGRPWQHQFQRVPKFKGYKADQVTKIKEFFLSENVTNFLGYIFFYFMAGFGK